MGMKNESVREGKNPGLEEAVRDYLEAPSEEKRALVVDLSQHLIQHFVKLYSKNHEYEDLFQAGAEGVLKALERYDPERGVLFSTFASHCILGEIRHEIRREKTFYRPAWIIDLQHKILEETDRMIQRNGAIPTLAEVAAKTNVKEDGLGMVMQAGRISLEELDRNVVRSLQYRSFQLPIEDRIVISQAIESLSKIQKKVCFLFFYKDMTQSEIAQELGISQRQVSRVLNRGLAVLADQV